MCQHFLLSPSAKTLTLARVIRMTEPEDISGFLHTRFEEFVETDPPTVIGMHTRWGIWIHEHFRLDAQQPAYRGRHVVPDTIKIDQQDHIGGIVGDQPITSLAFECGSFGTAAPAQFQQE